MNLYKHTVFFRKREIERERRHNNENIKYFDKIKKNYDR